MVQSQCIAELRSQERHLLNRGMRWMTLWMALWMTLWITLWVTLK